MPRLSQEAWGNLVSQDVKNSESIQKEKSHDQKHSSQRRRLYHHRWFQGEVYLGEVPTVDPEISKDLLTLLTWADGIRSMGVRANADTPEAAIKARQLGQKESVSAERKGCLMPQIGSLLSGR